MFDLEQAIADWRQQMLAAGIKTPVPLVELEIHLREDIAQQMQSGVDGQKAFNSAAHKMGHADVLKREFKKASTPMETKFVELAGIACVAVALLFSLWTFLFLFDHETGLMVKVSGLAAVATTVLGWRYNHKFLPVIRNQLARTVFGFMSCLGGVVWIRLFIINFLPHMMLHPAGMEMPACRLIAVFLWGWTVMALLGGVGHGLEKAAHRQNT